MISCQHTQTDQLASHLLLLVHHQADVLWKRILDWLKVPKLRDCQDVRQAAVIGPGERSASKPRRRTFQVRTTAGVKEL